MESARFLQHKVTVLLCAVNEFSSGSCWQPSQQIRLHSDGTSAAFPLENSQQQTQAPDLTPVTGSVNVHILPLVFWTDRRLLLVPRDHFKHSSFFLIVQKGAWMLCLHFSREVHSKEFIVSDRENWELLCSLGCFQLPGDITRSVPPNALDLSSGNLCSPGQSI